MQKKILAAVGTTLGLVAGATSFAGPAVAAPATAWVMPNVRNMVLQQAIDAVLDATGPVDLNFNISDKVNGQDVINQTLWQVCAQSPSSGSEISQETMTVNFYVKRFHQQSCT